MRCGAVRCGAVQCGAVRPRRRYRCTPRFGPGRCNASVLDNFDSLINQVINKKTTIFPISFPFPLYVPFLPLFVSLAIPPCTSLHVLPCSPALRCPSPPYPSPSKSAPPCSKAVLFRPVSPRANTTCHEKIINYFRLETRFIKHRKRTTARTRSTSIGSRSPRPSYIINGKRHTPIRSGSRSSRHINGNGARRSHSDLDHPDPSVETVHTDPVSIIWTSQQTAADSWIMINDRQKTVEFLSDQSYTDRDWSWTMQRRILNTEPVAAPCKSRSSKSRATRIYRYLMILCTNYTDSFECSVNMYSCLAQLLFRIMYIPRKPTV